MAVNGKKFNLLSQQLTIDKTQIIFNSVNEVKDNLLKAHNAAIIDYIDNGIESYIDFVKESIKKGDLSQFILKIDVISLIPLFVLYFGAHVTENFDFSKNFVEYGMSPDSFNITTL